MKTSKARKKQKTAEKKAGKRRKRGPQRDTSRDGPKNGIFHIRTVKRNRNENEAQKKSDFEHPTKTKKMK